MILSQFLLIPLNYLAYTGIYLAISPAVNTGSKLLHNNYTFTHKSKVSLTSENTLIFSSTSALNGVTCL